MPYIPALKTLTATTPAILNAIRNDLGGTYKDLIPLANDTTESIRAIGKVVMESPTRQNDYLNAIVNRIGMVKVINRTYTNPWAMFKKGMLDFGETIEEIFVAMAEPYQFNPADAENTVFKRHIPDVSSAFHKMNFAKQYPQTVTQDQLRQAFLSMDGITDLINKIIESMYTAMQYDEFIVMKYLLARVALEGKIAPVTIPTVTKANLEDIVTIIKATSSKFEYMSDAYNMAGVTTNSEKDSQYILLNSTFESQIDVSLLASAFNMDKLQFMGQRVGVDSFGAVDKKRLALLFAEDTGYVEFTDAEIAQLEALPAMLIDEEFFMIYDNLLDMGEIYNPKGRYWNYFLDVWKTFSVSPFANAVLFTTLTASITSVTVTPSAVTLPKGSRFPLSVVVASAGYADESVVWSVDSTKSVVTPDGILTIAKDETEVSLTVTATSVADETKSDTAVITIA